MLYRRLVLFFIGAISALTILAVGLLVLIDPVSLLGSPVIAGFNNQKEKEGNVLDVVKPYQYIRTKPKELYIGSSRVYVGLGPVPNDGIDAYNMGASSLSLPDMLECLRFSCAVHKPETVYMGLDFFQFGKEYYSFRQKGFAKDRLYKLEKSQSNIALTCLMVEDALPFARKEYLLGCYKASKRNKEGYPLFYRGCDLKRGLAEKTNEDAYKSTMESYAKTYERWDYEPKSLLKLQEIVQFLHEQDVKLYLFFNPISYDFQCLIREKGKQNEFERIKKEVAKIHKVYDFAVPSEITMTRSNYYDASHYRIDVGKRIKKIMDSGDA